MTGVLIGLGGKLRAGKDAVGDYLEEKHGYVKLGMSDALNEALLKLNPIVHTGPKVHGFENYARYKDLHDAVGYVEAKKNPEVRRLLQVLGTEVGREMIDPDVWVRIAEKKILEHWANGKSVVITAMRFPNEIEMLERLGGLSVWVERPDDERWAGTESTPGHSMNITQHASETSVGASMFQYVMQNDGTLEQLYRLVEKRIVQREGTLQPLDASILNVPGQLTVDRGETWTIRSGDRVLVISPDSIQIQTQDSREGWGSAIAHKDQIAPPYDR